MRFLSMAIALAVVGQLGEPAHAKRQPTLVVNDRCELAKALKVSTKPRGKGQKTRLKKGTVLRVLDVDRRWAFVAIDGTEDPGTTGYLRSLVLQKRCQRVVPAKPAAPTAPPSPTPTPTPTPTETNPPSAPPGEHGQLASAEAMQPHPGDIPEGTHQCDYSDVADCNAQCDNGHAGSCYLAAEQHRNRLLQGDAAPPIYRRVASLFTKGCNRNHGEACLRLGEMYQRGEGLPANDGIAAELYGKACERGSALGCTNLGYLYLSGEGVAPDAAKATELYTKACDGGSAQGCTSLGSLYQSGQGVAKDAGRAAELFQIGCEADESLGAQGCANLAYLYETGQGVEEDIDLAVELYNMACEYRAEYACQRLRAVGLPVPTAADEPQPAPAAAAAEGSPAAPSPVAEETRAVR